ncbi:eukaryotic translation initiation factor 5-like isoform X3 [Varroa jacobsoni]|nr:eukaryotic translation initiation factor 5-like isoform X3 [Varroa jacobsoni]
MQRRMQELSAGAKTLMLDGDTNKPEEERINIFYKFVQDRLPITSAKYKELLAEASRLEIKEKATMVLCELVLDAEAIKLLKANSQLFRLFTNDNKKAQKYLLGGVEQTIKLHKDALLAKSAVVLKVLYDEDIVDEDQLLEWAKKVSKRYVGKEFAAQIHEKAEPFITWLKNAEEESEDDESDEDAVEIEYDDRHTAEGLKEVKEVVSKPNIGGSKSNGNGPGAEEDDEDDLDIDDI